MKTSDKSINYFLSRKVIEEIHTVDNIEEKILCNHCLRTASNGIRCMGICVADNDYWIKIIRILFPVIFVMLIFRFLMRLNKLLNTIPYENNVICIKLRLSKIIEIIGK